MDAAAAEIEETAAAADEIEEEIDALLAEQQAGSSAQAAGKKRVHPTSRENLGPKTCNAVKADGSRCLQKVYPR